MFKSIVKFVAEHQAAILIGAAVVGTVGIAVAAAKDSKNYEKAKVEAEEKKGEPLNKKEKIKIFVKSFIRTAVTVILTAGAIIGSYRASAKKAAAVGLMYAAGEKTTEIIADKMIENGIAPEKAKEIISEAKKEGMTTFAVDDDDRFIFKDGSVTFKCSLNEFEKATVVLSRKLQSEMFVTINEFYDIIADITEQPIKHAKMGDKYGFDASKSFDHNNLVVIDPKPIVSKGKLYMDIEDAYNYYPYHKLGD